MIIVTTGLSACEKTSQNSMRLSADMMNELSDDGGEGATAAPLTQDMNIAGEVLRDARPEEIPDQVTSGSDMTLSPQAPFAEFCEGEGLSSRPFLTDAPSEAIQFGDIAGDFAVQTLRGSWRLSEMWSGCESYVFLVYFPDLRQSSNGGWIGDQLWESDASSLMQTPKNTHYFFISFEEGAESRQARMVDLYNRMSRSLNAGEQIPDRIHFVTDRLTEVEGSVSVFITEYLDYIFDESSFVDLGDRGVAQAPLPFAFGIDRLQRWDSVGSLNEVVGRPMIWSMASYLGSFYNHISSMYERALGDGAIEITLVEGRVSERVFIQTVELPEADLMTSFDTLELDISVTCPHRNVYACSEWDRIARVEYCRDLECMERYELARWITPYWRRGERRWIWDASPFLSWIAAGGPQTFRVEMGPSWERATERDARVMLRLRNQSAPERAVEATRAFTGGGFGPEYNTREPFTFTPPVDVTRVELVLLLSGHGQSDANNCAEWCDHRHQFTLNEIALPLIQHEGEIGSRNGCAELAHQGVSPGQFGNWAPERAYWCPGLPVQPIRIDLTERVRLGESNQLSYHATLGAEIEPQGGEVALSAYVVYSR